MVLLKFLCDYGLLFLLSVFLGVSFYFTRTYKYWYKRGVKIKPFHTFFGNLGSCIIARKSLTDFFQEIYKYGENEQYIGFYALDKPYLMIRDPELIKCVLIKDFSNFTNRNLTTNKKDSIGHSNLFIVKNPAWKYLRQRLAPVFSSGRLKNMFAMMLEIEKDLGLHMESLKLEGNGRDLDIKSICVKFTTDVIGITSFGMRFHCLTDPDVLVHEAGKSVFETSYKRYLELLSTFFLPLFVKMFGFYAFGKKATYFLKALFQQAIEERIKSGIKRADLVDFLINIKNEQDNDTENSIVKLDDDALSAQATIFFVGGFETSSLTMTYVLYELAKHPEIQSRVRKEIWNNLEKINGELTYELITSSFPYLDMVISESLRLHPPVAFLDRNTLSDYDIPETSLTIEAGTPIIIPIAAIHMDPKYFPEPHIFDPDRFSPENKKNIIANTYMPFGDGPRMCVGMRLAFLQINLGLIHLLSKYEYSICKETLIPMKYDRCNLFSGPLKDIVLRVKKI